MPEGPEVWIVSQALNKLTNNPNYSETFGKHLFITEPIGIREITFGLTGKLKVEKSNENKILLEKMNVGFCFGDDRIISENLYITIINESLGLNFMKIDKETFNFIGSKWSSSKKKLGALLLDQKEISGIGVAWGSEILHKACLDPDVKACDQNLSTLANALYEIQQYCIQVYTEYLQSIIQTDKINNNSDLLVDFINKWYKNLYIVREMNAYKKGEQIKTGGRIWYK
uniref:DNA glycosylase/AP lyase H2TH DNA-binding domain-containing protein n=1 Tax=viral metagenome TaxID=1070528 RepID=A0A6C0IRS6_9ZZZZ